ncbi:MAG: FG-GAP-like repeat-containing protein [bacterium]
MIFHVDDRRKRYNKYSAAGACLIILILIFQSAALTFPRFWGVDSDEKFQQLLDEGRALRSRRLFDQAISNFNRILDKDPLHDEATYEVALTYFQARDWQSAMDWFDAVRLVNPQRREAFGKRWLSILNLSRGDSLLEKAARQAVRREIADFLKSYPWDWETLAVARVGAVTVSDSLLIAELTSRLLQNFPDSPAGYDLLSNQFYDGLYPIWLDTPAKISYITDFLTQYPASEFRETAWTFLLYNLHERGDSAALRQGLVEWMAEDPINPLPYERAVSYLLECGGSPDSLLPVARKAVELCAGWRGKSLKPVQQRIWDQKNLYAGTRLNIGRLLIALNRTAEATLWLQDGIRHSGFDVDDEGTNAAFEYYLGVAATLETRWLDAFDHFSQALIEGDTRSKWTALADSARQVVYSQHLPEYAFNSGDFTRLREGYNGVVLEDVTDSVGLSDVNASRIAWGDANSDGFDDLLLNGNRLFLNQGGSNFIEITEACSLTASGICGGVWADCDLDGDLDIFGAGNGGEEGGDRLWINAGLDSLGIPQFSDVTTELGNIQDHFPTEGAAWGDWQNDGRPDLYVANYESSENMGEGLPDYLYLNLPDSTLPLGWSFRKVDAQSGLAPPFGEELCGRGVNWGDFDGDGDQDIYVSNYRLQQNLLWENTGSGSFEERACFYQIAGTERDGCWGHTIGSEWGDFDNDGDLDLFTANLAHPRYLEFSNRSCLYENRLRQDGVFREVRRDWRIKYEETHADPAWGDVDADGDLDLYLTSVYPKRRSFLYQNDPDHHRFTDVTYLAGVRIYNGWGCAFSDYDNDGDLDLAVGSGDGIRLFRNRGTGNHWLELDVAIPGGGLGTRVLLSRGKELQLREIQGGKGTTTQHSQTLFFGLGKNAAPVDLEIRFPQGEKMTLKKITLDQKLRISVIEE